MSRCLGMQQVSGKPAVLVVQQVVAAAVDEVCVGGTIKTRITVLSKVL
jgi:hypothetical protein